jgi:hypothetical protein
MCPLQLNDDFKTHSLPAAAGFLNSFFDKARFVKD